MIKSRVKNVLLNERGSASLEMVVIIAVVILIVAALITFRGATVNKLKDTANSVSRM